MLRRASSRNSTKTTVRACSKRDATLLSSMVVTTTVRSFASTAPPIDVQPLRNTNSNDGNSGATTSKASSSSGGTEGSIDGLASSLHQSSSLTTADVAKGGLSSKTAASVEEQSISAAVARAASQRRPTDPYIPNAQKELPPYVERRGASAATSTAAEDNHLFHHYSTMTAEEAAAYHASKAPLLSHQQHHDHAMSAAAATASSLSSMFASDSLASGGGSHSSSPLDVSASSSPSSIAYERPGLRREMIVQRRAERRVNYRNVQLEEALRAQADEANSEGGREAHLVSNANRSSSEGGGEQTQRLTSGRGGTWAETEKAAAEEEGDALLSRRDNKAHLAPSRATAAELTEQAVRNQMRFEDIDAVNRSTLTQASKFGANSSSPLAHGSDAAEATPSVVGDFEGEEQRFRDMMRTTGKFYLAQDDRVRKDVFGAGYGDGLFKYRSTAGTSDEVDASSYDRRMPLIKIDPLQRKRLIAERKDAVLGVGPLGKLEAKKKAKVAELAYALSLLPEERRAYRAEKKRLAVDLMEREASEKRERNAMAAHSASMLLGEGGSDEADPHVTEGAKQAFLKQHPHEDPAMLSAVRANTQYPILREVPKLFQTRIIGQDLEDALISYDPVPNNAPVPKAPMWTSSLSIPVRGRKFREDNWRNPQLSGGLLAEEKVAALESFINKACPQIAKDKVLEEKILVKPRATYTKGLYARRRFRKGEVIATIPIPRTWEAVKEEASATETATEGSTETKTDANTATAVPSSWEMSLTMESLQQYSEAVKARNMPSYASLHHMLAKPTTSLGVAAHPLFTEQLYLACLIACEKALGDESRFAPLFNSISEQCIDDDTLKEIHREAMEPHQYYEYDDHLRRYEDAIRRIQKKWDDAPHFDTIRWAVRFVLSRQRMVPVRVKGYSADDLNDVWDSSTDRKELDWFALKVRKAREMFYRATVPKEMVESAERVAFDTDKAVMPSVIPLVDMLHHDYKGVGTVVMEHCKGGRVVDRSPSYGSEADGLSLAPTSSSKGETATGVAAGEKEQSAKPIDEHDDVSIVIRANRDLEPGEELSVVYPKCYSVSFTLYKYGFLAYRKAEQDASLYYQQHGSPELSKTAWEASPTSPITAGDLSSASSSSSTSRRGGGGLLKRLFGSVTRDRKGYYVDERDDYPDPVGVDEEELLRKAKAATAGRDGEGAAAALSSPQTTYAQDVGAKP